MIDTPSDAEMNAHKRRLLSLRFVAIESQLAAIAEGRVVDGDPAEVELSLFREQDDIEFQLGVDFCDRLDVE
jgi:hypothetical protein